VTIQVRVTRAKGEPDLIDGPDEAALVVKVAIADVATDPAVAFMTGKLKSEGPTGPLLDAIKSGEIERRLAGLMAG
jgi:hypothetical protein